PLLSENPPPSPSGSLESPSDSGCPSKETSPSEKGGVRSTKTCPRCQETKALEVFDRKSTSKDGRQSWCRECSRTQARHRANRDATWTKFRIKRATALRDGTLFTIKYADIVWPDTCPVLGLPLDYQLGIKGRKT